MIFDFKQFITESADKQFMTDVKTLLSKIPKKHKNLIKDYKIDCECGNTLKGDKEHIGYIDEKNKKIMVASPFNYSRKFTLLHELGHAVWKFILTSEMKKEWKKIVKNTKNKQDQNDEELFSMAYACYYTSDHCPRIHDHPEWHAFIKKIN